VGLYAEHAARLDIKLINPGFGRTRITKKNQVAMPMAIDAYAAARIIARGLTSSSFEIHFPRRFTWMMKWLQWMPYRVKLWVLRKMHGGGDR